MLIVMAVGAMMLSAFATPKQDAKAESRQIQMNDDNWKVFREKVAYCDADTDQCKGYGTVYVNTDTYQVAIRPQGYNYPYKIDLGEYTAKEGYNMRFWHEGDRKYYYVNLFIPAAAFN